MADKTPKGYCPACARKLKEKIVSRNGKIVTVLVCKSPICKRYNQ